TKLAPPGTKAWGGEACCGFAGGAVGGVDGCDAGAVVWPGAAAGVAGRLSRSNSIALAVPTCSARWFSSLSPCPRTMCGIRSKTISFSLCSVLVCENRYFRIGTWASPGIPLSDLISCSSKILPSRFTRSEEHTSELQSRGQLVCRLLLE